MNADKPTFMLGYTTRTYLLLDLDNTTLHNVRGLTRHITQSWPEVGDALILHSSRCSGDDVAAWHSNSSRFSRHGRRNYHVVFSNSIGYHKCIHIIDTIFEFGVLDEDYKEIRQFRGDMTLRLTPKVLLERTIPKPQPVCYVVNRNTTKCGRGIIAYQTLYNEVK